VDPIGALYNQIEQQNHDACAFLENQGYALAKEELKLSLRRATAGQSRGRSVLITAPNTRERQDAIMNAATDAWPWFQVTNGGGPMNSNDALIAWARKSSTEKYLKLAKRKERYHEYAILEEEVSALISAKPNSKKWTVPDLKAVLTWLQGPFPTEPNDEKLSNLTKNPLAKLYADKYINVPHQFGKCVWTSEMENELSRLKRADISDLINDTKLGRAIEHDNEFLQSRLTGLDPCCCKLIICNALASLPAQEKAHVVASLQEAVAEDVDDSVNESFMSM